MIDIIWWIASGGPISSMGVGYEFSACAVSQICWSARRSRKAGDSCNDSLWPVARSYFGADQPTLSQSLLVGHGNAGYRMAWHSVDFGRGRHVRVLLDCFTGLRSGYGCSYP